MDLWYISALWSTLYFTNSKESLFHLKLYVLELFVVKMFISIEVLHVQVLEQFFVLFCLVFLSNLSLNFELD